MTASTAERLVAAAADLLDTGGESAVTLRAVGAAIGVSHNAPYKHFASRDDLLAAVATADFAALTETWGQIRRARDGSADRLVRVLDVAIRLAQDHPARYRLLFNSPGLAARVLRDAAGLPASHADGRRPGRPAGGQRQPRRRGRCGPGDPGHLVSCAARHLNLAVRVPGRL
jgi:AcrR family transcriptional regulator